MKQSFISKSFYSVFITAMIIFTAGVCIGGAVAAFMPHSVCKTAADSVISAEINPDRLDAFTVSFINFLKPVLFIWLCGFFKFVLLGICAAVVYRGIIMGYFIGALTKTAGVTAALANSAALLFPHYLIFIPVMTAAAYFSLKKRNSDGLSHGNPPYFICLALLGTGCAIAALCDAYLSVFLLGLVI